MHKANHKPITDIHTYIQAQPQTKTTVAPPSRRAYYEPHAQIFSNNTTILSLKELIIA